jgi:hypothetical protein
MSVRAAVVRADWLALDSMWVAPTSLKTVKNIRTNQLNNNKADSGAVIST